VVMGEPSESARDADTLALLRYGFDQYRVYRPVRRRERLAEVEVRYRGRTVPLLAAASYAFTGPRGERVTTRVEAPKEVDATRTDEALGQVVVIAGGKQVGAVPLVAAEAVEAATTGERAQHFLLRPLTLLAVAATVLLCALVLRRRTQSR
jgi:serine-type D-Ala-D-Ala carboxypeptidase (penicillin-binding protein 5/6)